MPGERLRIGIELRLSLCTLNLCAFHRSRICMRIDEAGVELLIVLKGCRMRALKCGIDESEAACDRSTPRPTCPSLEHHAVKRHRVFTLRPGRLAVV